MRQIPVYAGGGIDPDEPPAPQTRPAIATFSAAAVALGLPTCRARVAPGRRSAHQVASTDRIAARNFSMVSSRNAAFVAVSPLQSSQL